ncbi:hypothetical protein RYA05_04845 [Pseudomonas syringae pv. actinidiae]|nr:hypothetical protein [Pseudomonas syringae pv. actinidiae]
MPRGTFRDRYLRRYSGGVQVRIVRIGINYTRKFSHRAHGGKEKAEQKARNHRDKVYIALFGTELCESSHLLKPRGDSEYPPGVSPVVSLEGSTTAFIASWQDREGQTVREYFSVLEHGQELAVMKAIEARVNGVTERID